MNAPVTIAFKARPIAVVSHPRSGTHLTIDGLRHFFVECERRQRFRQSVHDLYVNLDRLHPDHPFAVRPPTFQRTFETCPKRVLIKTHCTTMVEQVAPEYREFGRAVLDYAAKVYVVRDVRPVLASYMALRPMKDPDSPQDMATFLRSDLDGFGTPAAAWAAHVNGWLDQPGVVVVKFEAMMRDYAGEMERVGRALGLTRNAKPVVMYPKPASRLENQVRRWLGRQISSSIDNLRMGIATPKWREVMSAEDLAIIRREAGEAMARAGYEW